MNILIQQNGFFTVRPRQYNDDDAFKRHIHKLRGVGSGETISLVTHDFEHPETYHEEEEEGGEKEEEKKNDKMAMIMLEHNHKDFVSLL